MTKPRRQAPPQLLPPKTGKQAVLNGSTKAQTPCAAVRGIPALPEPRLAAQALSSIFQPIARLMIDHGLQLQDAVELLKLTLVQEAARTYALQNRPATDTRVAILTGVHRKDVRRLGKIQDANASPEITAAAGSPPATTSRYNVPVAAAVVARWISEPRYLNADQSVRALARTPGRRSSGEPDFTELVAEVSRDVGARAVLDELQRLGVVAAREDGQVHLLTQGFVPHQGLDASFKLFADNLGDHLATAVHNLAPTRSTEPALEQSAFCADLAPEQAFQLHTLARGLWGGILPTFLQMATVAEQRSQELGAPKVRVRFGVYFNESPQYGLSAAPKTSELAAPAGIRRPKKVTP